MLNYKNGKIYKLISSQTNKIYVGSTAQKYLSRRFAGYKVNFENWINNNVKQSYCTFYELLIYNDVRIILIENYPCESKEQLRQREQFWLDKLKKNCVNVIKSFGWNLQKRKIAQQ